MRKNASIYKKKLLFVTEKCRLSNIKIDRISAPVSSCLFWKYQKQYLTIIERKYYSNNSVFVFPYRESRRKSF